MKRIYNNINLIDIKAPFSYTGFLFEYLLDPALPIGMHWVNIDSLTDNFEFSINHKDGESLSFNKLLDYFLEMYIGNPTDLSGDPMLNYWYNYIRKYGITQTMFAMSISKSPLFAETLTLIVNLIKNFYDGLDLTMQLYTRDPRSGYASQGGDYSYKEEFNWGYQWIYGELDLTFNNQLPHPIHYIDFNELQFTSKSETLYYKNEYGINKSLTTQYPLSLLNPNLKIGDVLRFNVAMKLNGKYWLTRTTPDVIPPFYEWKASSYCYSWTDFQIMLTKVSAGSATESGWEMKTYKNNVEINLADELVKLGTPTSQGGYGRNVGTNWKGKLSPEPGPGGEPVYVPYEPTDIPKQHRIWEYEEPESESE